MQPRDKIDAEVVNIIRDAALVRRWTPAQTHRHLLALADHGKLERDQVPEKRTVERRMARLRPQDDPAPWHTFTDPLDAALALDVIDVALALSEGRIASVSPDVLEYASLINHGRPELPAWIVYRLALEYQQRSQNKQPTAPLDAYLAYAPWRDAERFISYTRAIRAGHVQETDPLITEEMVDGFAASFLRVLRAQPEVSEQEGKRSGWRHLMNRRALSEEDWRRRLEGGWAAEDRPSSPEEHCPDTSA